MHLYCEIPTAKAVGLQRFTGFSRGYLTYSSKRKDAIASAVLSGCPKDTYSEQEYISFLLFGFRECLKMLELIPDGKAYATKNRHKSHWP